MEHILTQELNNEQIEAVLQINNPLLVLAGAGTGKTKVITTRIAYMIQRKIAAHKIVALSFTNKAAREMRERLKLLINKELAEQVELSTFHSFALGVLRAYPIESGLTKNFAIADENEAKKLLNDSIKELNLSELFSIELASAQISNCKDNLMTYDDFKKSDKILDNIIIKNLFYNYEQRLRLYKLIDFDDIVYLASLLIKNNKYILEQLQYKYTHFLIDEFQDTSFGQFEFMKLLAHKNQNICVVGDDDQSIYSWRGAKPDILFKFLEVFSDAKKISLEQNYRCSPYILEAANKVIANNKARLPKTLRTTKPKKYPLEIYEAENEKDEAHFIADKILDIKIKYPHLNPNDIAILLRASSQSIAIEQALTEKNIAFHFHGNSKFFDRYEIKSLFYYLKLAHNQSDLNSFFQLINIPDRKITTALLKKIKIAYEDVSKITKNISIFEILKHNFIDNLGIKDFVLKWELCHHKYIEANSLEQFSNALRFSYENMGLKQEIFNKAQSMQHMRRTEDMLDKVFNLITKLNINIPTLTNLVDALHLDTTVFHQEKKDIVNKIQLMTVHASKGLEFEAVFIPGIEENIYPHEKSLIISHGIEEERRLFYVALTRAKQFLFLSHCGLRIKSTSQAKDRKISRFLEEIPKNICLFTEADPETEEAKRREAARKLFQIFR